MTKETKGVVLGMVIMLPILWLTGRVVSMVLPDFALWSILIVFLLVNFLLARIFSLERSRSHIFSLFIINVTATLILSALVLIIIFILGVRSGEIRFGKVGG